MVNQPIHVKGTRNGDFEIEQPGKSKREASRKQQHNIHKERMALHEFVVSDAPCKKGYVSISAGHLTSPIPDLENKLTIVDNSKLIILTHTQVQQPKKEHQQ